MRESDSNGAFLDEPVISASSRASAGYSERYYQEYLEAAQSHWWFRGRERVARAVAQRLVRLGPGATVIDVGSGPGGPARSVFPDATILAVDLSSEILAAYRQADGRAAADAAQLPLRNASVEGVCAFDVLEHLADDGAALREWRRVLAPGGWLVLTVPAYPALWSAHDDINRHHRRYLARGLTRRLTAAGFALRRMTYFNSLLLPAIAAVRWAERLSPRRAERRIAHAELDCSQRFPAWIERSFEGILSLEAWWARRGDWPAGVSLCAVARAPGAESA